MAAPGVLRPGEVALPFDPAGRSFAGVTAIGHLRTPWSPGAAPKNIRLARETGKPARIELLTGYASALTGLTVGQPIIVLTWMDRGRRDLVLQAPAHARAPRGTFALRSPVRPNPIALSTVLITGIDTGIEPGIDAGTDTGRGIVDIDASDCFDGTPVLDIKPWIAAVDLPPGFPTAP
jgi:tRNA (Thr-GGU) A37 N-methylase